MRDYWEMIEVQLPGGYRIVGTVDRPSSDGNIFTPAETYDLGQNAEGNFLLFRRKRGDLENSYCKGEVLSEVDLAGFGLMRHQSIDPERAEEEGNFSSLCRSHLIGT